MLNGKTRELAALQAQAQARLAETRRAFLDGMKIAKEVKADLDYVHRKVRYVRARVCMCVCVRRARALMTFATGPSSRRPSESECLHVPALPALTS